MIRGLTGRFQVTGSVGGEQVRAFVPSPLPPSPALALPPDVRENLDQAHLALGRLDTVSSIIPDPHLFHYSYVRKEAVLSSQIEGTASTLSDLMLFELDEVPGVPVEDVTEVSNYVSALQHGLDRIREGFPISGRLIREVHRELLSRGRGASKAPGDFRRSQNWIGGTRPGDAIYVPPPAELVLDGMSDLERFVNDEPERTPPLLKAALAHVQFETIHPFLDGNGRVGRLLVTLILCNQGILREPLLYLSLYLKRFRAQYYQLLQAVRTDGDWEAWVGFFATAVRETATEAVTTAQTLVELFKTDRERLRLMRRAAGSAPRVLQELERRPIGTVTSLTRKTGLSAPTVNKALDLLMEHGIVKEMTGRRRNRVFSYGRYMAILNQGTEVA